MLTEAKIKSLIPGDKPYKVSDGRGLCMVVKGNSRWWHFNYHFDGKPKKISLGVWPDVPLEGYQDQENGVWVQGARDRCEEARRLIAQGINPSELRKAKKAERSEAQSPSAASTFEGLAREWHSRNNSKWTRGHAATIMARLEQNCFAAIGAARLDTIKAPDILKLLRKVEERGAIETAYRVQNILCQVWDYGIACGCVEHNPARPLRKALASVKKRHLPALTDPVQVGAYMRAIDGYRGGEIVRGALMFGVLTFVRPGELRKALWSEIDTEHALWNIRAERMKMREAHTVPLSRQALEVLNELRIRTSNSEFIFPSPRSHKRPLSENGVLAALRTMGYDRDTMSGHGVRAMARTILDEQLHVPPALIEQQLAHVVRDPLGRAYNRTTHLPARKVLMQLWSDALEHLQSGNSIDSFDRQTYQV